MSAISSDSSQTAIYSDFLPESGRPTFIHPHPRKYLQGMGGVIEEGRGGAYETSTAGGVKTTPLPTKRLYGQKWGVEVYRTYPCKRVRQTATHERWNFEQQNQQETSQNLLQLPDYCPCRNYYGINSGKGVQYLLRLKKEKSYWKRYLIPDRAYPATKSLTFQILKMNSWSHFSGSAIIWSRQ